MYCYLRKFDFASLFIKELHWSEPVTKKPIPIDERHMRLEIARVAESPVFEISTIDGQIPDAQERDTLSREGTATLSGGCTKGPLPQSHKGLFRHRYIF